MYVCACITITNLLTCMKVGFPSANDCPASEFSRMDFDSDEEFMVFYTSEFK